MIGRVQVRKLRQERTRILRQWVKERSVCTDAKDLCQSQLELQYQRWHALDNTHEDEQGGEQSDADDLCSRCKHSPERLVGPKRIHFTNSHNYSCENLAADPATPLLKSSLSMEKVVFVRTL